MPSMPSENSASTAPAASSTIDTSAPNTKRTSRARTSAPNAEKPTAKPTMPSRAAMAISIAWTSGDGGELAQRAFEDFRRLAARDQVAVVDDHGRDRVDAELLPVALAFAHLGAVLVGI